ncbi:udp-glucose 6-dehydrogenase [Xylaria arbuscula]|nr:udp-glucose 6-dehydrogenase [Xylaria arbuscula]
MPSATNKPNGLVQDRKKPASIHKPEDCQAVHPAIPIGEDGTDVTSTSINSSVSPNGHHESSDDNLKPLCVHTICFIGAGYVGGPTGAVIAYHNPHTRVIVADRDPELVRRWNSAHLPLYEPGLEYLVRISRDGSRRHQFPNKPELVFPSEIAQYNDSLGRPGWVEVEERRSNLLITTEVEKSISKADIIFIAVNTPTKSEGMGAGSATDMTAFEAATNMIANHARAGAIIVEKSTMSLHRPGVDFEVLSNPEFLAAGTAVNDLLHPSRVVIGHSKSPSGRRSAHALATIYKSWVPSDRIITTDLWSSELAKLVANAMLAQRISSINSISAICEKVGADIGEIATCVGSDPRIGDKYLTAGIGFGGSCLNKDLLSLIYLAESLRLDKVAEYWRQVIKMNEFQQNRFSKRVIKCLNDTLAGKKITLLGYAFKTNTSDTRNSPALEIIKTLAEENPEEIAIFDPLCDPIRIREEIETLQNSQGIKSLSSIVEIYDNPYEACIQSNAVLLTGDCKEFRNIKFPMNKPEPLLMSTLMDPRPFRTPTPTETELFALHQFLSTSLAAFGRKHDDPLQRLNKQPVCDDDCAACDVAARTRRRSEYCYGHKCKDRLHWDIIADHLAEPKWIFDGKGVIDPAMLSQLGVNVESIGR